MVKGPTLILCYCLEAELPDFEVEQGERLNEKFRRFSFARSLRQGVGFLRPKVGRSLY